MVVHVCSRTADMQVKCPNWWGLISFVKLAKNMWG